MTTATKHTYLRTHRLSAQMLVFNLRDEDERLMVKARAARTGRAAKTIVKEGRLRVTAVALRKEAVLQSHQVEGDCTIQVLSGHFVLQGDRGSVQLAPGDLIAIQRDVIHSAMATSDCMLLLTVAMEGE